MQTLTLMTSNIRFANNDDGIHDWETRRPLLAQIYREHKLDILATQEGREGQIKELDVLLESLVLIDQHRTWIFDRMYPCLYVNPDVFLILESGDIWLSDTPDIPGSTAFESAFPRLCTWARLKCKKTNNTILVINTHLDHIKQETRKKQIEVLIIEVKKIKGPTDPLLILGDFNEPPTSQLKKELITNFELLDPWEELNHPEETSHHGFLGHEALTGERIDWILIPKSFFCNEIKMDRRYFEPQLYPSDHYPIVATVVPKCK
ncbi:MAG: endonuclease/exonuclease/phosphatase family protein [Bacteriovoracaceae bacterium]|nr:endonuclease/exonuclease/phosphatase family protein [Bacteriovoracaceae bacterium]